MEKDSRTFAMIGAASGGNPTQPQISQILAAAICLPVRHRTQTGEICVICGSLEGSPGPTSSVICG